MTDQLYWRQPSIVLETAFYRKACLCIDLLILCYYL
jgi:hypothetical protein